MLASSSMQAVQACDYLFVDVGANSGDSLIKWFTQPNCYERCYERSLPGQPGCLPSNETCGRTGTCANANETCFCNKLAKQSRCGWEWPWWLPVGTRQKYCAEAFEPNPLLQKKLSHAAHTLTNHGRAPSIKIHNGTALSLTDGYASFGLDLNFTYGSSLILDKKTMDIHGKAGRGGAVGENKVTVRTLDAVRYIRSLPNKHIALKLDVEGSEFEILRDLLVSGALCERVDFLWIEWHTGGRINWKKRGLPISEGELTKVYSWMLGSVQNRRIVVMPDLSPHCRTFLGRWA